MKYTSDTSWAAYKEFFTQRFTMNESYVICGVGNGFQALTQLFPDLKIRFCLDNAAARISLEKWDLYPYESLKKHDAEKMKYIITAGCEYYSEIKNTLFHYGIPESHICGLPEILHFWGQRYYGKIFATACNAILLTSCNLRCRACSQLVPHIKHHRYNRVETVIENLDQYFRVFDYVKELELIGGETMLYRELAQICKYVREHFSNRYHELKIFTNGLIVPKEDVFVELAKLERAHVLISDYTRSTKKEPGDLIKYLKEYQIPYTLNNAFGQSSEYQWFDFGDPSVRKTGDAAERFQKCSLVCQSLIDQKIYYCAPSCGASVGNITELDEPECSLDLPELERLSPAERADQIGKFNLGFLDRGCLEFCKFCNGFGADINHHYVTAGEQC